MLSVILELRMCRCARRKVVLDPSRSALGDGPLSEGATGDGTFEWVMHSGSITVRRSRWVQLRKTIRAWVLQDPSRYPDH
jgi:hypothetical protein